MSVAEKKLSLAVTLTPFPFTILAIAVHNSDIDISFHVDTDNARLFIDGNILQDEMTIIHALAKDANIPDPSSKTNSFADLGSELSNAIDLTDTVKILDFLDYHLAFRTFLIGHEISLADWIIWGSLKGHSRALGLLKGQNHHHIRRWFTHIDSFEMSQRAFSLLSAAKANKLRSNKTAAGFSIGLPNAQEGHVVTRFPPEPSGYLHIGHAKAVMLNHYFAKMYKGKLLIRFDDTNPSKEKTEFEETILEDLRLLNVVGDDVSHTSDYFEQLHGLAINMIKAGKAYADDTDATQSVTIPCSCSAKSHGVLTQMAFDRFHGIASARRDATVEENLQRFAEMTVGLPGTEATRWCLRAKIDMTNHNKAMRDPVIYRCNALPHHRTGTKWKVYPTYDFACPLVDSIEGVTHALRTNEYRDRNSQYYWMIDALGLRPVHIWDFSRLNFIYTVLSKRKLQQFVDKGLVYGWDDPRFPTVRGIRRRGLTVEALQQFMLQQGPSQAVISLEWDTLWTMNKKIIDPIAPRYWAIAQVDMVKVDVIGGPVDPFIRELPKHKKNPDVGLKTTIYSSSIFIEQVDAASFDEQEEITLMDWGNAVVCQKTLDSAGHVINLKMKLNLEGDYRATKKKITWLSKMVAGGASLVNVSLLDYDYLITKKKLEEGDNWEDFVPAVSEFRVEALADHNVLDLLNTEQKIIQFERKGYYSFDGRDNNGKLMFIRIPDGRAASLASKVVKEVQVDG